MPADEDRTPSPLSPQSRAFLERLLADFRRAALPNAPELIEMIERTLAGLPITEVSDQPADDEGKQN
jgi:hypothetical protein